MTTPNIPFILAAFVALGAVSLHVYTMEVWIWPKLKPNFEAFPATPLGNSYYTMALYRITWHYFTVSWLLTIALLLRYAFSNTILYGNLIVILMMVYWVGIVISIFITAAVQLLPGQSYIKTMIQAFQWMLVLAMVGLMYWGTTL